MRCWAGLACLVASASQEAPGVVPAAELPDYDCRRTDDAQRSFGWSKWRAELQEAENWMSRSEAFLAQLTPETRDLALQECPLGVLMADVLRMLACVDRAARCAWTFEKLARDGLVFYGLRVLMGTSWPIYEALHSEVWERLHHAFEPLGEQRSIDGCGQVPKILNWRRFRAIFELQDWYQPAVDVAYGPEMEKFWRESATECPLGFATANLVKAMLCSHTESICFRAHESFLGAVLEEVPLIRVARSGWPLLKLLGHVARAVRRHGFHLDFLPEELFGTSAKGASLAMQDLRAVLPELRAAALQTAQVSPLRLVYATMAYGPRFAPYVSRFVGRLEGLGIRNLVVFCLDEPALAECRKVKGYCVRGTPSILNKFTLPLVLLHEDVDVFWLDMDVFLFQNPLPSLNRHLRQEVDLLTSGAFAVDCVCSGVVLFRATDVVRHWLQKLLVWMYQHPYEHDQKAFSAFLRAGERVAFEEELTVRPEEMPRWGFLDPETEFVSARHVDVAGWFGDADRIVAFHMLHGDSDESHASRQFAARNSLGVGYTDLLDLFFNQTELPELYRTPLLPHRASEDLKAALWRSRWPSPRPRQPSRCNETVPMRF